MNYYPLVSTDKYVRVSGTGVALGYRMADNGNIALSVYGDIAQRLRFEAGSYVFATDNPLFRTAPQNPWAITSSLSKDGRYITLMATRHGDTTGTHMSRVDIETGNVLDVGTVSAKELVTCGTQPVVILRM